MATGQRYINNKVIFHFTFYALFVYSCVSLSSPILDVHDELYIVFGLAAAVLLVGVFAILSWMFIVVRLPSIYQACLDPVAAIPTPADSFKSKPHIMRDRKRHCYKHGCVADQRSLRSLCHCFARCAAHRFSYLLFGEHSFVCGLDKKSNFSSYSLDSFPPSGLLIPCHILPILEC